MQKVFALIGMIAVGSLVMGTGKALVGLWWPDSPATAGQAQAAGSSTDEASEREAVMQGIMWVRATLPRKVDDHTTLVAVGLDGKTYWSRRVLDVDAGEISDNRKADLRRDVTTDVCKRRTLGPVTHADAIVVYHVEYVDRGRNPIQTFEVTKHDCL